MSRLSKVSDLCWEGLTLKHVSHKGILIPYFWFISVALLFELFLIILSALTGYISLAYRVEPTFLFYIGVALLICLISITIPVMICIYNKFKNNVETNNQ